MASQTDIVNMALVKIGQSTISSIDEDTPTATKMHTIYDLILDEALAEGPQHGWKFAREQATISVDADSPDSQYDYRYKLPDDLLRIDRVHADGMDYTDWVRQGQYILTNQVDDEINLNYVKRVTITGLFPPHFIKVLYTMLAFELAFNIVKNTNLANSLYAELKSSVLPKAIAMDERDQYVEEENHAWIDAGRRTTVLHDKRNNILSSSVPYYEAG